jgi:hypothetical protein
MVEFVTDKVTDISPVRALSKLSILQCVGSGPWKGALVDMAPIEGMNLIILDCGWSQVDDLSPLRAMPLYQLKINRSMVHDLSPLKECKGLKTIEIKGTKVTQEQVATLQKTLPNCKIEWDDPAKPKTPEPTAAGTK